MRIVESSDRAKLRITSYEDKVGVSFAVQPQTIYPLDRLSIGQSLEISFAEANEKSLRVLVVVKGKKSNKKFAVLKHRGLPFFEVARIA